MVIYELIIAISIPNYLKVYLTCMKTGVVSLC